MKVRPELVISIFSLALSLTAAVTNLFQARLQREQQQTAVWPYVELNMSYEGPDAINIRLNNKGVGPAKITNETYLFKGRAYTNMVDLTKAIGGDTIFDNAIFEIYIARGKVLSPQEEIAIFRAKSKQIFDLAFKNVAQIEVIIEYESIYGKKWRLKNEITEEL
jgi:hypothetical protein